MPDAPDNPRARVLARWPEAIAYWWRGGYGVYRYGYLTDEPDGQGATEAEAWADAAGRLG